MSAAGNPEDADATRLSGSAGRFSSLEGIIDFSLREQGLYRYRFEMCSGTAMVFVFLTCQGKCCGGGPSALTANSYALSLEVARDGVQDPTLPELIVQ